jgi:uncharacterized protein YbjT (DUF2867 family)
MMAKPILVVGATGYVGGRLVPLLLETGYTVRAVARSTEKILCRPWGDHPLLQVVKGDALDAAAMRSAADGCEAAFYLVHSMVAAKHGFVEADRRAAQNMVAAADAAGLTRIIYLGGLGDVTEAHISKHLRSRHEVAEILQGGTAACTTLRAAMILGSGSASFEILRYLVERLPVMLTPRWVFSPNQPIAVSNVLAYLKGCLETPETAGRTFDIGGPDIVAYRELLDIYAEEAGLRKRWVIPVPVLTPTLSAHWIHLISPVPHAIALPLTEGLTSEAVCRENRIRELVPQKLLSCREAIRLALDRVRQHQVESCWMDAGQLLPPEWAYCGDAEYAGGTVKSEGYRAEIEAGIDECWQVVSRLGGANGWHAARNLWRLRGAVDRIVGGPGLRRGRRHPSDLAVGDAVDFWRVLEVSPPRKLLLVAEMKLPGEAMLGFHLSAPAPDLTVIDMVLRFMPKGLPGMAYWKLVAPLHKRVFRRMLAGIAHATGRPLRAGPSEFVPGMENVCRLHRTGPDVHPDRRSAGRPPSS